MGSRIATRIAAILVGACACACFGSYTRALDETRAGLLGLDGRALRACLGVPNEFTIDGELEQQTYRFDHEDAFGELDRHGDIGGGVLGNRWPSDRAYDSGGFPRDEPDRSFCQLDFELTRGRVTRVLAQGLTREGMNADGSCLLRAEPCLDYGDPGRAPDEE
ncbi:MAG: hypothetical protein WEF50_13860 [Myxococcota bacterium]